MNNNTGNNLFTFRQNVTAIVGFCRVIFHINRGALETSLKDETYLNIEAFLKTATMIALRYTGETSTKEVKKIREYLKEKLHFDFTGYKGVKLESSDIFTGVVIDEKAIRLYYQDVEK